MKKLIMGVGVVVLGILIYPLIMSNMIDTKIEKLRNELKSNGIELEVFDPTGYFNSTRKYYFTIRDTAKFEKILKSKLENIDELKIDKDTRLFTNRHSLDDVEISGVIENSNYDLDNIYITFETTNLPLNTERYYKNFDKIVDGSLVLSNDTIKKISLNTIIIDDIIINKPAFTFDLANKGNFMAKKIDLSIKHKRYYAEGVSLDYDYLNENDKINIFFNIKIKKTEYNNDIFKNVEISLDLKDLDKNILKDQAKYYTQTINNGFGIKIKYYVDINDEEFKVDLNTLLTKNDIKHYMNFDEILKYLSLNLELKVSEKLLNSMSKKYAMVKDISNNSIFENGRGSLNFEFKDNSIKINNQDNIYYTEYNRKKSFTYINGIKKDN